MSRCARSCFELTVALLFFTTHAAANPLAGLAPADDARKAVAIGPAGEVYAPDGKGDWVRTTPFTTADKLQIVGRAGGAIVAWGDGVVYKLADNGWSAIRLHQTLKAMMSGGPHAVAAVKRQLYALDRVRAGEPEKLALAPADVRAIGAGTKIVIATAAGLARVDAQKVTPIAGSPKQVTALIDDRWALVANGVYDIKTTKTLPWPAGKLGPVAAVGDKLAAVATVGGKLELWTIDRGGFARTPIAVTPVAAPVGLVVDRTDRATIALADGRILSRSGQTWAVSTVREALPTGTPGSPPAHSP